MDGCMSTGLSQEDLERIQRFSKTPAYARTPEMLMPDGEPVDD
jgi:hypothetical protein